MDKFAVCITPKGEKLKFHDDEVFFQPDFSKPWQGFFISNYNSEPVKTANEHATSKEQHLSAIDRVINEINDSETLEKVVLAQCSVLPRIKEPQKVFDELTKAFEGTFRYYCQHPVTGMWLGATPELLLDYDYKTGVLETMSLAGTMKADEPWDDKNRQEQAYVTRFIIDILQQHGFTIDNSSYITTDLRYGQLKHLCNRIHAVRTQEISINQLLQHLSPTPAVCGLPREEARKVIERLENFSRRCYSGYIGIRTKDRLQIYVNLRCARVTDNNYFLYSGGGITSMSDPETEWLETQRKISRLRQIIQG